MSLVRYCSQPSDFLLQQHHHQNDRNTNTSSLMTPHACMHDMRKDKICSGKRKEFVYTLTSHLSQQILQPFLIKIPRNRARQIILLDIILQGKSRSQTR